MNVLKITDDEPDLVYPVCSGHLYQTTDGPYREVMKEEVICLLQTWPPHAEEGVLCNPGRSRVSIFYCPACGRKSAYYMILDLRSD